MKTRIEKIVIVNEIIKEIASYDREFFKNKHGVAYIIDGENDKLYMFNEYSGKLMDLETNDHGIPDGFHHGGTLWRLIQDFIEYINGENDDTNGNNGNGGLYCNHWGYNEDSMVKIREKAKKLGYLKN